MLDRGFFYTHFLSNAVYALHIPQNVTCPAWGETEHYRSNAPLCWLHHKLCLSQ